ncbi:HTH-type transcriptional repressor PurR [Commensalibacter sp. Nvir]|uniref:LacI family DNA-binding transcriptional regulator n=1 Tax=Commensalibacter sp. Nvir TaxID=3069817 RepID=UPI002D5AF03A|nr:HTH-type transcriptional repressor PurR [Commensalibacter sp. Nvir]
MNIKELSAYLNLSTATVSKALNDKSDISICTRNKVKEAAIKLGYHPNISARSLRSCKSNTVALLLSVTEGDNILTSSFFMRILKGLQPSLKARDIDLVIYFSTDSEDEHQLLQKIIQQQRVDAIILTDTRVDDSRINYLHAQKFPFVTMGQSKTLEGEFNWVDMNHYLMGQECVRHAVRHKAKRIALVTQSQESMHGQQFLQGCVQALQSLNQSFSKECVFYGNKTEQSGIAALEYFFLLENRPDFIIFINDLQLMGANSYLTRSENQWLDREAMVCAIESSDFVLRMLPNSCLFTMDHQQIGCKLGEAVLRVIERPDHVKNMLLKICPKCKIQN